MLGSFADPNMYLLLIVVVVLLNYIHFYLQQGNDAELNLKPFMPLAAQVLECSFLSGVRYAITSKGYISDIIDYKLKNINFFTVKLNFLVNRVAKIDPLLGVLKPKLVLVC